MEDGGLEESLNELSKEYALSIGTEFESEDDAYDFYNEHGKIMGFGIRRAYRTKSRKDHLVINRKFVCSKVGEREKDKRSIVIEIPRSETRTNCKAFMFIALDRQKDKWIVKKFEEKHNHLLNLPQCTYLLRSHRRIRETQALNIDIAVDSGLSICPKMVKLCARSSELKAAYEYVETNVELMCAHVDKMFLEVGDSIDKGSEQLVDPKFLQGNGLKKKVGVNLRRCKRRLQPWHEKNQKKKKVTKATRIGQDVPMPMPYVPEMFNGESNLSSQTTYEVTGTESYLQDDEFFALFSNPDKSRVQ